MKQSRSILLVVMSSIVVAVVMILAANMSVMTAGGAEQSAADPVVTTPIATPGATVAPDVAAEMNGHMHEVTMADGIRMHKPKTGLRGLAGNGQGNGCMKQYGKPGQCLPVQSLAEQAMPDMQGMDHSWTCRQVRMLFPKGIRVMTTDVLGLDRDGDRMMCDRGDGGP